MLSHAPPTAPLPPARTWVAGAQLSRAEAQALRVDGLLRPVLGDVHVPVPLPADRAVSAAAVRACVPAAVLARCVLHRASAAWFLACGPAPQELELACGRQRRSTTLPPADGPDRAVTWRIRETAIPPQDRDRVHGVMVTTPLRTAADLACWHHPQAPPLLDALLGAPHLSVGPVQVLELLRHRSRLPQRSRGLAVMSRRLRGPSPLSPPPC